MPVPSKTNSHILTVYYTNTAVHINHEVTNAEQKETSQAQKTHWSGGREGDREKKQASNYILLGNYINFCFYTTK